MPRFIALLRGVNVGKGNRVPIEDFKALLEDLGYTEVKTLLNSGNAVFTSTGRSTAKHAASIKSALEARLAVSTPTIVKSATELESILREAPMVPPDSDHSRFFIAFAQDEQGIQALAPLQAMAEGTEAFTVTGDAAYLHCSGGVLESKIGAALLGKAGKSITLRNWATALKLAAMVRASAA